MLLLLPSRGRWLHDAAMKGASKINPFGLRIPTELRKAVETAASASGRSVNSEILHLISVGLSSESLGNREDDIRRRLAAIEEVLDRGGRPVAKGKRR